MPTSKILTLDEVPAWTTALKAQGKIVVATNGCFDLLHVGHVRYLEAARRLGDVLLVGLNSDASVGSLKGPGRPINNEADRAEVIAGLEAVGGVVIFSDTTATKFLAAATPHIYVKGGDYTEAALNQEEVGAVRNGGGTVRILPLVPGKSTTALVQQLCHTKP